MKAIMAPADAPNEDAFVLGDAAAEVAIELRPNEDENDEDDEGVSLTLRMRRTIVKFREKM